MTKRVKKVNKSVVSDETDIKGAIIVVSVLMAVVVLIYFLTLGAQKIGWFDEHYVKPELNSAIVSYENILAGDMFNRKDTEYYVMIADFDGDSSIYLSSLGALYNNKTDNIPLYSVNLGNEMNKSIISETNNVAAQSTSELKINNPTLIKILNGRNVKYVEGDENIKTELGV